ncbi:MAG: hypothetical protein TEF_19800 [Rhizobiales bacterium NRL2]|jgi:DnaK suppressor protein|nr:MAG: hypothetical protein TEF_19800 [Rhizobiales bacterium NRL2]
MDSEKFRKLLEERRQALTELRDMSAESRRAVELDQSKVGRLSRMDAMQQQEMAKASEQTRIREIQRIDVALERIESGDYGYCTECDEEIAEKRLLIDPAAARCIDCAELA